MSESDLEVLPVGDSAANEPAEEKPTRSLALSRAAVFALAFSFASFLAFSIAEVVYALAAGSLSMLGDAASMIVDAVTYGCNLFAVYISARGTASSRTEIFLTVVAPTLSART